MASPHFKSHLCENRLFCTIVCYYAGSVQILFTSCKNFLYKENSVKLYLLMLLILLDMDVVYFLCLFHTE